jgi:hypothetical protein
LDSFRASRFACTASWVEWMYCGECLDGCRAAAARAQPNTQLAAVSWSCGSQACAVLHPCKRCMSPTQCGASGYSMKSCRSSYKSGLSVALQLSPPQACCTCATALQRHTALANTMASSCGDYAGQQKKFVCTCTTWCLAPTRTHTMRSRTCSHQLVAQQDCCALALVGRFLLLLAAAVRGPSAGSPAARPRGEGGVPGPSRSLQHEGACGVAPMCTVV